LLVGYPRIGLALADRLLVDAVCLLRGWLASAAPSCLLVSSGPVFLCVAKPPLHIVDCRLITCVLADVITDLDRIPARSGSDLYHNVEWH
jgi:hypothetical protein